MKSWETLFLLAGFFGLVSMSLFAFLIPVLYSPSFEIYGFQMMVVLHAVSFMVFMIGVAGLSLMVARLAKSPRK